MQEYITIFRGVCGDVEAGPETVFSIGSWTNIQETVGRLFVKAEDKASFRILHRLNVQIPIYGIEKNEFVTLGRLTILFNSTVVEVFKMANHHAFGSGFIAGENGTKIMDPLIRRLTLGDLLIKVVNNVKPIESFPVSGKQLTPKAKGNTLFLSGLLFTFFAYLNT